jgi:hypothetical protein
MPTAGALQSAGAAASAGAPCGSRHAARRASSAAAAAARPAASARRAAAHLPGCRRCLRSHRRLQAASDGDAGGGLDAALADVAQAVADAARHAEAADGAEEAEGEDAEEANSTLPLRDLSVEVDSRRCFAIIRRVCGLGFWSARGLVRAADASRVGVPAFRHLRWMRQSPGRCVRAQCAFAQRVVMCANDLSQTLRAPLPAPQPARRR